ncbi:MAG: nitroreductase family protein [Candidatus Omnitrophota bacterium]|nr:nitroreductase family protein [Candidatus Omnitrophota bacterium]
MDFAELVRKRSSIRKYDSRPIKREDINKCLEAARLAPSACNSQPWQFIVVDQPQLKDRLVTAMLSGIYSTNSFIKHAPVLVVVVTEKSKWFARVANFLRDIKMYLVDVGIACEHFILQAAEIGIGTCWLGWFNEKAAKKALGISRHKRIDVIISMGYPVVDYSTPEKNRKPLNEMSVYA